MGTEQMRNEQLEMSNERRDILSPSSHCSLFTAHCSFVLLTVFFFLPVLLSAQTAEIRFTQRLIWTGDEYARRYEVVIEREDGGRYLDLRREFTTALFIEVSLLPGKYRFRVIPYNFLDQPRNPSEWMYIEVLAALFPVLDDIPPEFFLSDTGSGAALYEMRVSGKNLVPGAEIFMRGPGGEHIVPFEVQTGGDDTHVRLFFEKDQFVAGVYELVVINPGGLQTGRSGIIFPPPERVQSERVQLAGDKVNLFLSAAWLPSFTVYDEGNRFFGREMSLAGVAARFGVVWAKPDYLTPGLELLVSYNFFDDSVHLLAFGLNLSALKRLPEGNLDPSGSRRRVPGERTALMFRLGAGYSALLPDPAAEAGGIANGSSHGSPPADGAVHVNIGISFLLFVMKNLYLETGLDYAYWFTNPPTGTSSLRPWVGVGFSK
jgi:hypothetical protein